jgi:hypothetical protein
MKTNNSETIKNLKANMRRVNELLTNYQNMEAAQDKARTAIVYDAAGEQMKYDYNMIIAEMNKMLNELDILGVYCGELDVMDYNRIEKRTFNA